MRKFLLKSIHFILPIFILLIILEFLTRNANTVIGEKKEGLITNIDSIQLLILGNSHTGDGLNPSQFNLYAYNMAMGSQSLYYDIEITKKYLSRLSHLKYVLISVDYHSLYFTHEKKRDFLYHNYYNLDYNKDIWRNSNMSTLFYGYGFKLGLNQILKPKYNLTKGWAGYKTTNQTQLNSVYAQKRVDYFNYIINENISNKNEIISELNLFISLLKSKNITPIIIALPCHKYFNNLLNKNILKQNEEDIHAICRKNNIEYFNYLNEDFPDSLFYNVDHLNEKGATQISDMINIKINDL